MWQFVVLWEHSYCCLEASCMIDLETALECVEVAFYLQELEWNYTHHTTVGCVLIVLQCNELKTYGICESLLVDDILNLV